MTWHCMLITHTFSSCQSNSLLAADSSAVQFGTLRASQMSALVHSAFSPLAWRGLGILFPSLLLTLCWFGRRSEELFRGVWVRILQGDCPSDTPHIHPKPHLFICLPVWSAAKWVSSFCPKWCCADDNFRQHQIAAWLLIGGFHHSHKPNKTPKPPASVSVKTKQQQQQQKHCMIHLCWWKKNCSFWET